MDGAPTVDTAPLTITAANQTKSYGETANLDNSAFTASGLLTRTRLGSVTISGGGSGATAAVAGSPYAIVPSTATGSGLSNYRISYQSGSLTINPAAVVVSAVSGSSTDGSSPANAGLSAIGLQNGRTVRALTGLPNSFGNNASPPGTYTLNVSGTLSNSNYLVTGTNSGSWVVCASEDTPRFAESIEFPTMTAAELRLDTMCVQLSR